MRPREAVWPVMRMPFASVYAPRFGIGCRARGLREGEVGRSLCRRAIERREAERHQRGTEKGTKRGSQPRAANRKSGPVPTSDADLARGHPPEIAVQRPSRPLTGLSLFPTKGSREQRFASVSYTHLRAHETDS